MRVDNSTTIFHSRGKCDGPQTCAVCRRTQTPVVAARRSLENFEPSNPYASGSKVVMSAMEREQLGSYADAIEAVRRDQR